MQSNQDIQIAVKPESFEVTGLSKNIFGFIYYKVGENFFPFENWNDFVVPILGWWLEAALSIINSETVFATLYFMDGPYCIYIHKNEMKWTMQFVATAKLENPVVETMDIDPINFLRVLQMACEQTLQQCEQNGWTSKDLENLKVLHLLAKKHL